MEQGFLAHDHSRCVKTAPGEAPAGAGEMSPLTNRRRAAAGKPPAPPDFPHGPL